MRADVILGEAWPVRGPVLRLEEPLSLWDRVDPATGRLSSSRSPQDRLCAARTVLRVPEPRGLSSSSAMGLDLINRGLAPAATVSGAVDAIIRLGILVGIKMGLPAVPLLVLAPSSQAAFRQGATVTIDAEGRIAELTKPEGSSLYCYAVSVHRSPI